MSKRYPTLLIFSSASDEHVQAVLPYLNSKTMPCICDFSSPNLASVIPGETASFSMLDAVGDRIFFENVESIWWRNPSSFSSNVSTEIAEFVEAQNTQFWGGFLALLPSGIRWYNHFQRAREASRKMFQLQTALESGFRIPKTLITSDPAEARRFVQETGKTICKSLITTEQIWRPTQLVSEDLMEKMDHVSVCPLMFQEHIEGEEDVRIIVIDDFVEAVAFDIKNSRYPYDVSIDALNRCRKTEIPDDLKLRLKNYMLKFGLRFGAFDFRLNTNGEFVFFEINPSGAFLYLDVRAKTCIARAMAAALSTKNEGRIEKFPAERVDYKADLPLILCAPERKSII